MTFHISPRGLARLLLVVVLTLAVASAIGQLARHTLGEANVLLVNLYDLVKVNNEANLPAWYSSFALLLCAILLATIARAERGNRHAGRWAVLAALFFYIAVDEGAVIHERFNAVLVAVLAAAGGPHFPFPWVVVGGALVLAVGLAYRRFLADLPAGTRRLFLLAGALYVGGALGLEVVGGRHAALQGKGGPGYDAIAAVEDLLEMLGVVVFLYALMAHLGARAGHIAITIADERSAPGAGGGP